MRGASQPPKRSPWRFFAVSGLHGLHATLATACGSERAITETLVVIDSDLTPGSELARVDVGVYPADGQGAWLGGQAFEIAAAGGGQGSAHTLPFSFGVAPNGGASSRAFRVVVRGFAAAATSPSVSAQVVGVFVPGQRRRLDVFLARRCLGVTCQEDTRGVALTTCVSGTCLSVVQTPGVSVPAPGELGGYGSNVVASDDASTSVFMPLGGGDSGAGMPGMGVPQQDGSIPVPTPAADAGGTGGGSDAGGEPSAPDAGSPEPDGGSCTPPASCPPGSVATACACVDIEECAAPDAIAVCAPTSYPCSETVAPGYTCLGHRADWPMPDVGGGAFAPTYVASGNSDNRRVTDAVTGLVWQMRPGRDSGAATLSYAQAEATCQRTSFGGLTFRMPSLVELVSILDPARGAAGASNLLADPTYFQGPAGSYWTSTLDPANPSQRLAVSFLDGSIATASAARVRCVASPNPVASGTPTTRLTPVTVAGQVLGYRDQRTRLGWASAISPTPVDYAGALAFCGAFQYGGASLRVPTYKELLTALRLGPAAPYWDAELSTPLGPMWSATAVAGDAARAYLVDFATGLGASVPTSTLAYARCVTVIP